MARCKEIMLGETTLSCVLENCKGGEVGINRCVFLGY